MSRYERLWPDTRGREELAISWIEHDPNYACWLCQDCDVSLCLTWEEIGHQCRCAVGVRRTYKVTELVAIVKSDVAVSSAQYMRTADDI
jgi:hypothetical protein